MRFHAVLHKLGNRFQPLPIYMKLLIESATLRAKVAVLAFFEVSRGRGEAVSSDSWNAVIPYYCSLCQLNLDIKVSEGTFSLMKNVIKADHSLKKGHSESEREVSLQTPGCRSLVLAILNVTVLDLLRSLLNLLI